MNTLRVWGGGLYESDDFYDLCDELGLLVWQDFAFACSHVPDDAAACAAVRAEAAAVVRRLRNHPSLALWCGNNENAAMVHERWGGADGHPPRLHGAILYDEVLPQVVAALDPGRPYLRGSPTGGAGRTTAAPAISTAGTCGTVAATTALRRLHGALRLRVRFRRRAGARRGARRSATAATPPLWRRTISSCAGTTRPQAPRGALARLLAPPLPGGAYPRGPLLQPRGSTSETRSATDRALPPLGVLAGRARVAARDCWPALSWAVIDWLGELKPAARELERSSHRCCSRS
jgi:beta-mannosidase